MTRSIERRLANLERTIGEPGCSECVDSSIVFDVRVTGDPHVQETPDGSCLSCGRMRPVVIVETDVSLKEFDR